MSPNRKCLLIENVLYAICCMMILEQYIFFMIVIFLSKTVGIRGIWRVQCAVQPCPKDLLHFSKWRGENTLGKAELTPLLIGPFIRTG